MSRSTSVADPRRNSRLVVSGVVSMTTNLALQNAGAVAV